LDLNKAIHSEFY
jgi:3-oxoacyl-[acyl-carrier-protein] synthase II